MRAELEDEMHATAQKPPFLPGPTPRVKGEAARIRAGRLREQIGNDSDSEYVTGRGPAGLSDKYGPKRAAVS